MQQLSDDLFFRLRDSELFNQVDESVWQVICAKSEFVELKKGQVLFHRDDPGDAMYVVILGQLNVFLHDEKGRQAIIGKVDPFMPVGEIQALIGGRRTTSVCANSPTRLLKIPPPVIEYIASNAPDTFKKILNIARKRLRNDQLRKLLPNLFGTLDKTELNYIEKHSEWVHLCRGEVLCRQGDPGDCLYIVVNGRLQAVKEDEHHNKTVLGTIGRGELLGEIAFLTEGLRSATLLATRESDLVKISMDVFERLANDYPRVSMSISKTLAQRILKAEDSPRHDSPGPVNMAIVALCPDLPLAEFSKCLATELSRHSTSLHLNSRQVNKILGLSGLEHFREKNPYSIRLSAWFTEMEARYDIMIYEADMSVSAWTKRCLQNADKILILVPGNKPVSDASKELISFVQDKGGESSNRALIFIHPPDTAHPSGSAPWLEVLPASEHYHVMNGRISDIARVARMLSGNAFNLVLSGGAASGFAHLGAIRALMECEIPIDTVSGTSVGGIIAAQYAMGMGMDYADMIQTTRCFFLLKPLKDITLPLISFNRALTFDHHAKVTFRETKIEDLWLPFFCISTNLTSAATVIHRKGSLYNAAKATCSVPALFPPTVQNSEILVDGGILNNLPVDIARRFFKGKVIAVDATGAKALRYSQKKFPSPWKLFWNRMIPLKNRDYVPNILDIIYSSMVVGSRQKTEASKLDADFYLRPPLEHYSFLDVKFFDEIVDTGYQYAKKKILAWKENMG